jgi:hypothetical protein
LFFLQYHSGNTHHSSATTLTNNPTAGTAHSHKNKPTTNNKSPAIKQQKNRIKLHSHNKNTYNKHRTQCKGNTHMMKASPVHFINDNDTQAACGLTPSARSVTTNKHKKTTCKACTQARMKKAGFTDYTPTTHREDRDA